MSTDGRRPSFTSTPLAAVCVLTSLASVGTGVIWNAVSFIAKNDYKLSQTRTFWLYAFMGAIYVLGALGAGPFLKAVGKKLSPRAVVAWILSLQAVLCSGPLLTRAEFMLWIVGGVTSLLSSVLWPIVESYVTAGRHGPAMRNAIGVWNLVWTGATALSMYAIAPLIDENARHAIVSLVPINAIACFVLFAFNAWPGEHLHETGSTHVGSNYPMLLKSARILLPLSYIMTSALSPLMPYLLAGMHVSDHFQTPITGIWMIARFLTMLLMWRADFWHGRWGTLLLGGVCLALGFAVLITAPVIVVLGIGLTLFGLGMGTVYFAAIYYALAVGRAEVDAGGTHEALIGVGYTFGPVTGLIGTQVESLQPQIHMEPVVITLIWGLTAVVSVTVVRAYRRSKSHS
ncbi:MAG TPA: hypothetical protein VG711_02185 [Phycisphaerales bacterium]|nr:hypothetical protein [Phycisphaerales bacterium]